MTRICGNQYERPEGRQRGDRIVDCDLPAGHDGDHMESDTENTWPYPPSTEAVGEVRRRVEQVLGDLDVEAIERQWLAQCATCDAGLPEYGCSHPDEDYRPVMLSLVREVKRLRALQRPVLLFGRAYIWRDPKTGEEKHLAPQDVTIVLSADQVTEVESLRAELEASALAAERLFEQRDTAIAEATKLRAEVEALRAEVPYLESLGVEDGAVVASVRTGRRITKAIAANLIAMLDKEGGANYVQYDIKPGGQTEPFRLICTRPGGKSPHELRQEAEAERDTAIRERDEARNDVLARDYWARDVVFHHELAEEQGDDHFATVAKHLKRARAERAQAVADLRAFSAEVTRLYEVEREAERILGVIAHRHRHNPDAMAMEPGDAQRALAAIFEAVDAYNTKEASDAG